MTRRIYNTSFAQSKWPNLHRAYVIGGISFFVKLALLALWVEYYYAFKPVFPYFIYYSHTKKIARFIGLIWLEVVVKKSFTTPMSTAINVYDPSKNGV